MLNTRHLQVFNAVCRDMNMTKASNELFISQPAISKTISEIESYYGRPLFERRNKTLFLTPDGQKLFEYSSQVINLMEKMDQNMLETTAKETIRVGASITVGTSILAEIASAYRQKAPQVQLIATVDNTDVIERALLDSKLDIAMVEGEVYSRSIVTEPLGDTEVVLVVNKDHPLYGRTDVGPEDLRDMDFVVREAGSKTRARFSNEMEQADVRWFAAWSCHNTQAIKNAVDAGLGIGVLSKLSVRRRLKSGQFWELRPFSHPMTLHLHIAYRKNQHFSSSLSQFKAFLKEQFPQMDLEGYKEKVFFRDQRE